MVIVEKPLIIISSRVLTARGRLSIDAYSGRMISIPSNYEPPHFIIEIISKLDGHQIF